MLHTPAPFVVSSLLSADTEADYLILFVDDQLTKRPAIAAWNHRLGGLLERLRESGDLTGRWLELVPILQVNGIAAKRLLLVGMGNSDLNHRNTYHDSAAAASHHLTTRRYGRIVVEFPEDAPSIALLGIVGGLMQGAVGPGLRKAEPARHMPGEWTVTLPSLRMDELGNTWKRAVAEARASAYARELVNLPPNDLYPETFAQQVIENATAWNLECTIWDATDLERERMHAILGVAAGSERSARLAILRYRGRDNAPTLALVGKGVTFDSGGLSLKTNEQMVDMKCDMAGAAAVLASALAIAELRLPINLLVVMPLVENMPGSRALKLGDVLRSRSGKTIEILNTDAEGRVILADALTYAVEQKVNYIIDLATLTGACLVALGSDIAGLMSNHPVWSDQLRQASQSSGDRIWPLPMEAQYGDFLRSNVADLKNAPGTRYGGAITAAKFLEQFVGTTPWAHLDIAGPAWAETANVVRDTGGTGFGVRLLVEIAHRLMMPN